MAKKTSKTLRRQTLRVPADTVPRDDENEEASLERVPTITTEITTIEQMEEASTKGRQSVWDRDTTEIAIDEAPIEPDVFEAARESDEPEEVQPSIPPIPIVIPTPPAVPTDLSKPTPGELYAERTRVRSWWEELFDDLYLKTVTAPNAEQVKRQCDFIQESLDLAPGASILDVGCGMGLQAVELASRGYRLVGLDLSESMLSRAAELALSRKVDVQLVKNDMRRMDFVSEFDAVLLWGTTFGYFDEEANRDVLKRCSTALKPNGAVLLDVVNRDHVLERQPHMVWFQGQQCVCMEETNFNYISSRLHVKRTVLLESGLQKEIEYTMRLYTLHELGKLMHRVGFNVSEVSGREATRGVFFGVDSPRLIMLGARRPRAATSAPPPLRNGD